MLSELTSSMQRALTVIGTVYLILTVAIATILCIAALFLVRMGVELGETMAIRCRIGAQSDQAPDARGEAFRLLAGASEQDLIAANRRFDLVKRQLRGESAAFYSSEDAAFLDRAVSVCEREVWQRVRGFAAEDPRTWKPNRPHA
jgi:hypothetical protein